MRERERGAERERLGRVEGIERERGAMKERKGKRERREREREGGLKGGGSEEIPNKISASSCGSS